MWCLCCQSVWYPDHVCAFLCLIAQVVTQRQAFRNLEERNNKIVRNRVSFLTAYSSWVKHSSIQNSALWVRGSENGGARVQGEAFL